MDTIQEGAEVTFDYTLRLEDTGAGAGSTEGLEPMAYVHGNGELVPGLEKQMEGMRVGDAKEIRVGPLEGYGLADTNLVKSFGPSEWTGTGEPTLGESFEADVEGEHRRGVVTEVTYENFTVDFNHPLAGHTLLFTVKIISISSQ